MKFIDDPSLTLLSKALNLSTPTLKVSTRVELYSCKAVSRERKLFKALESELMQDISHSTSVSPPEQHQFLLDSAFGPLDKSSSRKTLWLLIGLLNVAFPDHDFSKVRPEEFRREETTRAVLSSLSSALDHSRSPASHRSFSSYTPSTSFAFPTNSTPLSSPPTTSSLLTEADGIPTNPFLRQVLDPIIDLSECEVFSYTPDMDSDPHAAESDGESDEEGDSEAFEREDEPDMTWEMEGLEGGSNGVNGVNHHATGLSSSSSGGGSGNHYTNGSNGKRFFSRSAKDSAAALKGWYGGPQPNPSPMKSFSSFLPPSSSNPTTPSANGEEDDSNLGDDEDLYRESSTGGLLWSSNHFLFNKKMKRILFISIWARANTNGSNIVTGGGGGSSNPIRRKMGAGGIGMKRGHSQSEISLAAGKKVRA